MSLSPNGDGTFLRRKKNIGSNPVRDTTSRRSTTAVRFGDDTVDLAALRQVELYQLALCPMGVKDSTKVFETLGAGSFPAWDTTIESNK